ncbi:MAG: hypothetical protein ACI9OJ_003130 [Myxococcota bacterium]|jgi:hypothetical protein
MTDYNADRVEDQVQDISEYIETEAKGEAKQFKIKLIVLAVVCLILIAYFVVLSHWVKKTTEPETVAKELIVQVDSNVPTLVNMLEQGIRDAAPQMASFVSEQAIAQGVPVLVTQTEKGLDKFVEQLVGETAKFMGNNFETIMVENRGVIIQALKQQSTDTTPALALAPLRAELKKSFTKQTSGNNEARISVRKSLYALENINLRLQALASQDPTSMDRKQQMSSRLLKTYWAWMRQTKMDDVPDSPVPSPKRPE